MAIRQEVIKIKDLIKTGKLMDNKSFKQVFISKVRTHHRIGSFELELYNKRVYFTAKFFGYALPFRQCRVNRNTTLQDLFDFVENYN